MVIVFPVAGFHAFPVTIAFTEIDCVAKFDARNWFRVGDGDFGTVLGFGFVLQSGKDLLFVFVS